MVSRRLERAWRNVRMGPWKWVGAMIIKRGTDEAVDTVRSEEAEGPEPTGVGNLEDGPTADTVGSSLDHLIGSWSDAEADEIKRALEHFETIAEQTGTDLVSADGHFEQVDGIA